MHFLRRFLGRLTLLLLACAALYLYAAHQAGRKELRALCDQGVEPKVYRKVSAEGYFDGGISCLRNGCWDVLTNSGFRYIEVEQRDADPWDVLSENGYYRLSKVRQESGLCDARILEEMRTAVGYREFIETGRCIAIEEIMAPSADFGIFRENRKPLKLENWFGSEIAVDYYRVSDLRGGEIIAEQTVYKLYQNSIRSFSSFPTVLHCHSRGISVINHPEQPDPLESVIAPI